MNTSPFVSICIPAFNQINLLERTLRSIAEQTYKNFEVIISDDSTNDNVQQLVLKFRDQFAIRYHQNNVQLGSPANWNKLLELANGDLIKFIHHDDWLAVPEALTEFVKPFNDPHIGFAFCISEILNLKNNTKSFNAPPPDFLRAIRSDDRSLFTDNRIGAPSAVIYRKNQLRFDEALKYLVDVDFYCQLLRSQNFVFIDRALIINTSENPEQVTAASMTRDIQVGEYCYLYNKLFQGKIPGPPVSRFFIYLFSRYKIKSLHEISGIGYPVPRPAWFFRILLLLSRFRKN